jgi:hypothetical protein
MSELSTVAIKDGHRGHLPHHYAGQHTGPSGLSHQLDAERADRISRLAGLERVTTARNPPTPGSAGNLTPGAVTGNPSGYAPNPTLSYFDATGNPAINRERSTVGSASATGSVGARTTWAGSDAGGEREYDKMSESQDMDMDTSSVGGMSQEGHESLVGFGEGARTPARQSTVGSPAMGRATTATPTASQARLIDGMTYDADVVDTTASDFRRNVTAPPGGSGVPQQEAERIMRENMDTTSDDRMGQHGVHMRRGGPGDSGSFRHDKS